MRRDRVTFAMMLGVPLMLLILFGCGDPVLCCCARCTAGAGVVGADCHAICWGG
jgi:hypothetical protein